MTAKKWVTIVTFICASIAIILIFKFKCCGSENNIGYDIALAVFGSALLCFVMSLVEYFSERKRAMQQFWKEARNVLAQFRNAKYIHFDEPEDLVVECVIEHYNNKMANQFPYRIGGMLGTVESHTHQKNYIDWMEENESMSFNEKDDIDEILNRIYVSRMDNYEKIINEVIENYISLSEITLNDLDNAYGDLNFLFANSTIRLKAYNEIFNKLCLIQQELLKETYHFNLYKHDKGSFAVCFKNAVKISNTLFSKEIKKQGAFESLCIYQKEFDDIEDSLETFRTRIHYKENKTPIERFPVFGNVMNFTDSDENS